MKRIRRIASLLLAMVMVFGLTATAFAAETTENVPVSKEQGDDHTYTVYQILKGKLSSRKVGEDTKEFLVDIEWGDGVDPVGFLGALKDSSKFDYASRFADADNAEDVAGKLDISSEGYTEALAKAFANLANEYKGTGTEITANSIPLPPGYYLVVDSTADLGANDAYNSALLQVTDSTGIIIQQKYDVPKVDKSVKATADTDGEAGEAADVSIGDSVTFTLKGTLPKNYDDYEKYKYVFTDTLSAGLDYQDDAVVKLYADDAAFKADRDGVPLTCDPAPGTDADGNPTLTWTFADLKELEGVTITKDSVIAVTYTAKLTGDAVIGGGGNPNTVTLSFSNNPNQTGDGDPTTSETPPDKVLVFTYGIDGTKIEKKADAGEADKPLSEAKFILYRGKDGAVLEEDTNGNPTNAQYAEVTDGKLSGWKETEDEATVLTSGSDGKFLVKGLDDGTYYLKETEAPAGYNMLKEPIKIEVKATLIKDDEENPGLEELKIQVDGTERTEGNDSAAQTGMVSLKVENSAGVLLPSTGGMGTTLFYIVGAALVVAAGALLVMKRRTGEGK